MPVGRSNNHMSRKGPAIATEMNSVMMIQSALVASSHMVLVLLLSGGGVSFLIGF